MAFVVITLPINGKEKMSIVDFDKYAYAKENDLVLVEEPISIQKDGDNIILVFHGYKIKPL